MADDGDAEPEISAARDFSSAHMAVFNFILSSHTSQKNFRFLKHEVFFVPNQSQKIQIVKK